MEAEMGKFVSIQTELPGPNSRKLAERRKKWVAKPLGRDFNFKVSFIFYQ
jgi:hypothetical protein